jgi:hypothetical protein
LLFIGILDRWDLGEASSVKGEMFVVGKRRKKNCRAIAIWKKGEKTTTKHKFNYSSEFFPFPSLKCTDQVQKYICYKRLFYVGDSVVTNSAKHCF